MKEKFADYEAQSEQYYSDMLLKFKNQAHEMIKRKEKELEELNQAQAEHNKRILRLKERAQEKKIKNFWSDEEEEEEEEEDVPVKREIDMEEYEF